MKYKNLVEVNRKYWNDMVDLGKEHNIDPWKLVKIIDCGGYVESFYRHIIFTEIVLQDYDIEFAVTVIEGTPIFKGDKVYFRNDVSEFEIMFSPVYYRAMIKRMSDGEEFNVPIGDLMLKPRYKNVPLSHDEMHALMILIGDGVWNKNYNDEFKTEIGNAGDKIRKAMNWKCWR